MNLLPGAVRAHAIACWLMSAVAVGLLFSPPLANLAELLLLITVLSSVDLRRRVMATWRLPLVKAVLAFYVVILVGIAYSIAPPGVAASMAGGWRKLLLLPLALALFEDAHWKTRFLVLFVGVVTFAAGASFLLWAWRIPVPIVGAEEFPGVLLRNHATQGMMFAVGAFGAVVLAFHDGSRRWRPLLLACSFLLLANILLATPGRSGYLVLLVCTLSAVAGVLFYGRRPGFRQVALVAMAAGVVLAALALTPASRDRIDQAVRELQQYDQAKEETSMGIRVIFWKNTLELIRERPFLGYGTGAFGEAYGRKVAGQTGLAGTVAHDPHNQYMKIVGEHGLLGLAVFLGILLAALRQRVPAPWRLLALGVMAAWCATSMANSHFSTFAEGTFLYVWLGVMLARPSDPAQGFV